MQVPDVRYARCGDLSIAYRVLGSGPIDVVEVPPLIAHLEATWEEPSFVSFVERIARFARLIVFDKRGTGLSDRLPPDAEPGFETRAEDVRAVMDAAGVARAAVMGIADGGLAAIAFAATYPERTSALVLCGTGPGGRAAGAIGFDVDVPDLDELQARIEEAWGTGVMAMAFGETDEQVRRRMARMERQTCTPRAAGAYMRAVLDADLRPLVPAVRAPTLVIHNRDHPLWPVDGARYLAANIPGARYLEYAEGFAGFFDMQERARVAADIEEFLTGSRRAHEADRVLATVLYTDIVGSTERMATIGDSAWRGLLAEDERAVRGAVRASGGTIVKSLGDGFLLRFDAPTPALHCARTIVREAAEQGLGVRAGLHAGECEVRDDDLVGLTVHVGARVAALAGPGEVLVTSTVRDLMLGSAIPFDERGRTSFGACRDAGRSSQLVQLVQAGQPGPSGRPGRSAQGSRARQGGEPLTAPTTRAATARSRGAAPPGALASTGSCARSPSGRHLRRRAERLESRACPAGRPECTGRRR